MQIWAEVRNLCGLSVAPAESWGQRWPIDKRGFADDIAYGQLAPNPGIGAVGGIVSKHQVVVWFNFKLGF